MDQDSTVTELGLGQWTAKPLRILATTVDELRQRIELLEQSRVTQGKTIATMLDILEGLVVPRSHPTDLYPDCEEKPISQ